MTEDMNNSGTPTDGFVEGLFNRSFLNERSNERGKRFEVDVDGLRAARYPAELARTKLTQQISFATG